MVKNMFPPSKPQEEKMPGKCPECGESVDPGWVHCGYCGHELLHEDVESRQFEASTNNICPECGESVDPGWSHCGFCGHELILKDEVSIQHKPSIPNICPDCGKIVDPHWTHCGFCGRKLSRSGSSSHSGVIPMSRPNNEAHGIPTPPEIPQDETTQLISEVTSAEKSPIESPFSASQLTPTNGEKPPDLKNFGEPSSNIQPTNQASQYGPAIHENFHQPPNTDIRSSKSMWKWIAFGSALVAVISLSAFLFILFKNNRVLKSDPEILNLASSNVPATIQSSTITLTFTKASTATDTPTPTETPSPTSTSTPTLSGLSAILSDSSKVECRQGPGVNTYSFDGYIEDKNVNIIGVNKSKTWFEITSNSTGKTCWVPFMTLQLDSFAVADVPIVVDPPTNGPVYYGYRYAVCNTGWILLSSSFIQCESNPSCHLVYPQQGKAYLSAEEALKGCNSSNSKQIYCINTIPYTFEVIKPGSSIFTCNIPRVDHSDTDINYELFWVKIPY